MTTTIEKKIATLKQGDRVRVEYTGEGENPTNVTIEGPIVFGLLNQKPYIGTNVPFVMDLLLTNSSPTSLEILGPPEPKIRAIVVGREGTDLEGIIYQRLEDVWYTVGSRVEFNWSEIAHKVRVVKV